MYDVRGIKVDFPILSREIYGKRLVYLDNAATTQKPWQVIRSLTDYYENYNSNVHRGVHALSMEATDRYEEARRKVAKFINAESDESVIWTRNATEGLNLVAYSWACANIKHGDEIVLTPMEHHSNLVPWQKVARDQGAQIRFLPMLENGTLDVTDLDSYITPQTKLVSVVHMSNSLGTINPVKLLCKKAHSVGAAFMIDGAQSVPHMATDVQDLNCDFLVFSGHKMLGPTGIGVLYVKPDLLDGMEPFLRGGEMVLEVTYETASWNALPMRFEAGTPNISGAISLGAAVDYLENLGMDNIREHEKQLTNYALDAFAGIETIDVYGPMDPEIRGGIISFNISDIHSHDLGTVLDREGIAIRTGHHCTMPLVRSLGVPATSRASFYIYNTEEDIDSLVDGLHTALRYFSDDIKQS